MRILFPVTRGGVSGNTRDIRVEPGGQAADTGSNPTWDGHVLHPNREGAP